MRLSIIIPLYNQPSLIIKCLDSIPRRSDLEVLIVDDCSSDNSFEVVQKYSKDNSELNIKIFKTSKNGGPGVARNVGLDSAKGDYILFLDSDDYVYKDRLNEILDSNYSCDYIWFKREDNTFKTWYSRFASSKLIKRESIGKLRFSNKYNGEDSQFHRELNEKLGNRISEIRTNVVLYHYNNPRLGSLTWNYRRKLLWKY